ncbi:O-linked N-acetylglucosamine transferase, SPINDLY family protein [Verminephrobacter eiseniae]|uniref:TPR repeat protein n=3 Tax=Verminephrobacter eiseniae TaxID=364317 RepID=A1WR45_VEREI|nr:acetylglucosamine transferase [Verminephrobacter eiseniae]ABM60102.1 TPR repeat protein [Verminephrobacter eiseniae EF01-2]MCW5285593.1 acetylglucosamine transferase [Verminephrobacter eiseniae]MCW5303893.1 acetylglucosamine transferase [Verminephrobacter eiseniae]MCW8192075.1 acetylglucosamine transferase [Verminephrobacter eiseniae]
MQDSHPAPGATVDGRFQHALQSADWPLLARLCQRALRKNPRDLPATRLLGHALERLGKTAACGQVYRRGALLWPNDAELLINYASMLLKHAHTAQALPVLEQVCALRPDKAVCWLQLSQCCYLLTLHERGLQAAERAAALATEPGEKSAALTQKAIHGRELGQVRQAVQDCLQAIALTPGDLSNHTNRLLFMLADPQADAASLAQAARDYAAVVEPPLKPHWPGFAEHQGAPWRRLRVGFLSPDFRTHSVMYFVEGLLAQLDRRQFEVFAFYLFPRDDPVTERVRRHADRFVRLAGLGAEQQAQAIRAQRIDILIDLAGHTGYNGLQAMAHKAAPVQVSWLGFPATTGLQAVDYKLSDEITDPPEAQAHYTEQLYRLPTLFACYRPMSRHPLWRYQPRYQVQPTPALDKGHITFGCCNNLGKLGDEVLALWGQLLQALPDARLLIEGKNLDGPDFAGAYRQRCQGLGLDPERLELVAQQGDNQYLTYHRIDIALDPFPLVGGTTTFDALWMGLPVVSMVGQSFKSRMGLGLLSYLGRTEWLAATPADYLRIACALAADRQALNRLRLGLRAEVERSVLMREDLFNHHFGEGLRAMWLLWLARAKHPDDAQAQAQALDDWLPGLPDAWRQPPAPGVGLGPGQRISLAQAHQRLQALVAKARASTAAMPAGATITGRHWKALTLLAETVLNAVPNDPVALACLAEVEHAHGHSEFAVTYLWHATQAMGS